MNIKDQIVKMRIVDISTGDEEYLDVVPKSVIDNIHIEYLKSFESFLSILKMKKNISEKERQDYSREHVSNLNRIIEL